MTFWEKIRESFRLQLEVLQDINIPEVHEGDIIVPSDYVQKFKKLVQDYAVENRNLPRDLCKGYFVKPRNDGVFFPVMVLHPWWGMTPFVKGFCDRLARSGYVAAAPDLYNGSVAAKPDAARELSERLDADEVLAVLELYSRFLNQLPFVRHKKIALIGFGTGGTYALLAAARMKSFMAVVDYAGTYPKPVDELSRIDCPFLVLSAAEDSILGTYETQKIEDAVKEYDLQGLVHVYPKSGSDFFDDTRMDSYNYIAAEDAWKRTLVFLKQRVQGEDEPMSMAKPIFSLRKFTGVKRIYFKDGTVYKEINYRSGKLEGAYRQYYQKGGLRKEIEYRDDKRRGTAKEFYPNGRLSMEGIYLNDRLDGVVHHYYANGNLKMIETYRAGRLEGESKEYFEDGKIRYEWNFKDGTLEGLAKEYFASGVVKSRTIYDQGEAISIKVFDEEGKLVWIMG